LQVHNELLSRTRRVDSSDQLHVPGADSFGGAQLAALSRPQSDSRLARQPSPVSAARFYVPQTDAVQTTAEPPRRRTYKVLRLRKADIDRANKDKQHRLYPADFAVSAAVRSFFCPVVSSDVHYYTTPI